MADRKRLAYMGRFVIVCWLIIAGVTGLVMGIYHLCGKNVTRTILAAQIVIYSGVFGYMGWNQYKWKADRAKERSRYESWHRITERPAGRPDDTEDAEDGWK